MATRPRPRKRFGQHFLEPAWADKLVEAVKPSADDDFLEIGPGPGALTLRLAPRVRRLTAVELDRDMIAALQPRVPANVTLVNADFLEFPFDSLRSLRAGHARGGQSSLQRFFSDPVQTAARRIAATAIGYP